MKEVKQPNSQKTKNTNNLFYEKLGPKGLMSFAKPLKINEAQDLKRIAHYIERASSILEIGAGYGRVIKFLTEHYPQKQIAAVENASKMSQFLADHYNDVAKLYHINILELESVEPKPDLVLWMWSGLGDLSVQEQERAFGQISKLSDEDLTLIIDLPDMKKTLQEIKESKNSSQFIDEHHAIIHHSEFGNYEGYFPSHSDLIGIAEKANLKVDEVSPYTLNEAYRIQYIFKRKSNA